MHRDFGVYVLLFIFLPAGTTDQVRCSFFVLFQS